MNIKIYPRKVAGEISIPPSKSYAHRAIICASLANGESTIKNIDYSEDIIATINGMELLGAKIHKHTNHLTIHGISNFENIQGKIIDCNESGSTLRFLIPIFSLTSKHITFIGKNRLFKRPQHIYEEIFKKQKLSYLHESHKIEINGKISAGNFEIPGNVSSQFISGLLFILPLLKGDSIINIIPPFESYSYVLLTVEMLKKFKINIDFIDKFKILIRGGQKYTPQDYTVEGDFSQFAFFGVLGALNNSIECSGLNFSSLQGDMKILDILKNANIFTQIKNDKIAIKKGIPKALSIDLNDCPDLGPILMVLAAFSVGNTHIYNAKRLRYKESDRILAMETELKKLGIDIKSDEDNIYIKGGNYPLINKEEFSFYGQKDHRIIMSLAIMATILPNPTIIKECEYINKSYPNFFEDLKKLGVYFEIID